jgi:predicted NUDIX family phosphoesterase
MENVLCLSRNDFPAEWLSETAVVSMSEAYFFDQLEKASAIWMPRTEAEVSPSFKQLIPYMVVRTDGGRTIGCYRRNGTEARLHDLWSCGVGGHINPVDMDVPHDSLKHLINHGMIRELSEEIPILPPACSPVFSGIINEEKTPVGTVHFGLVYTVDIENPALLTAGHELDHFQWVSIEALRRLNLELWSLLAMDLLEKKFHGK